MNENEPIPGMTPGKASMLVKTMILAELLRRKAQDTQTAELQGGK